MFSIEGGVTKDVSVQTSLVHCDEDLPVLDAELVVEVGRADGQALVLRPRVIQALHRVPASIRFVWEGSEVGGKEAGTAERQKENGKGSKNMGKEDGI